MGPRIRWAATAVLLGVLPLLSGCAEVSEANHKPVEPYTKEKIANTDLYRIKLTSIAAQRLGIQTEPVKELRAKNGAPRRVVPYGALIYDLKGETYTYTSPEPLVFVRHAVIVDYIEGNRVYLEIGLKVGTPVVSVGAAELYGIEFGLGK